MSPFIADTFNRPNPTPSTPTEHVPDLSHPSVAGLAYMLRHKETWPVGFGPWNFHSCEQCAIGLANKAWFADNEWHTSGDLASILGLRDPTGWLVFIEHRGDYSPEGIATRLEHATATE